MDGCVWGGGAIMRTFTWGILSKLFNLHLPKVADSNMLYWQSNLPKMLNIEKHYHIVLKMEGFNLKRSRWHRQLIVLSFSPPLREWKICVGTFPKKKSLRSASLGLVSFVPSPWFPSSPPESALESQCRKHQWKWDAQIINNNHRGEKRTAVHLNVFKQTQHKCTANSIKQGGRKLNWELSFGIYALLSKLLQMSVPSILVCQRELQMPAKPSSLGCC